MRRALIWAGIAIVTVIAVVGVTLSLPAGRALGSRVLDALRGGDQVSGEPTPVADADLSGSGPGSLVSAMTMPGLSRTGYGRGLHAARVVYRSTNGDSGAETVVSGSVFTPTGSPPDGGWPIISLGHGTLGIDKECGPSLSDSLLGLIEPVVGFVKNGYAVAVADYQGLGVGGVHPYTDSKTAGLNMIDAVRALRHTYQDTSNRWLAFGGSQGGGASWAADEQAATYAPEVNMVGAVADSPVSNISRIVDKAQASTMTEDQRPAFLAIVETAARLHPDIDRDDFRRGAAAQYWTLIASCSGAGVHDRDAALKMVTAQDFVPASDAAADRLRKVLAAWALPQRKLSAPLSVAYGAKDTYIDSQWTTDAIARACALGGVVEWDLQPDKGHGDIDISSQIQWLMDRFAGKPVKNDCP
jgi:hypothetical protein